MKTLLVVIAFVLPFSLFGQELPNCGFTTDLKVFHFEKKPDLFKHMSEYLGNGAIEWRGYYNSTSIISVEKLEIDPDWPEAQKRYVIFIHKIPQFVQVRYSYADTYLDLQKDISYFLTDLEFEFKSTCK